MCKISRYFIPRLFVSALLFDFFSENGDGFSFFVLAFIEISRCTFFRFGSFEDKNILNKSHIFCES